MYKIQVITWWTEDRTMHVASMLAAGDSCMDVTGQPSGMIFTDPNMLVCEIWCDAETLAAIEAHPEYGPGAILWSEEEDEPEI